MSASSKCYVNCINFVTSRDVEHVKCIVYEYFVRELCTLLSFQFNNVHEVKTQAEDLESEFSWGFLSCGLPIFFFFFFHA